jgi:hypothetical protein
MDGAARHLCGQRRAIIAQGSRHIQQAAQHSRPDRHAQRATGEPDQSAPGNTFGRGKSNYPDMMRVKMGLHFGWYAIFPGADHHRIVDGRKDIPYTDIKDSPAHRRHTPGYGPNMCGVGIVVWLRTCYHAFDHA